MIRHKILLLTIILAVLFSSCEDIVPSSKSIEAAWRVEENHYADGKLSYQAEILYEGSDDSKVRIYNFMGIDPGLTTSIFVLANISGTTITIPKQSYKEHEIQGVGEISSNYNTITFEFNDDLYGNGGGPVTSTWTKIDD